MKKILIFVICMLLVSLQLVSCKPEGPQEWDSTAGESGSTAPQEQPTETPTEESTTAPKEEVKEPVFYKLTKNQLKVAKIVYADQAPIEIQNAAKAIQDRVIELYKTRLVISSDTDDESAIEIVIGDNTNRNLAFPKIHAHEYGYVIQGQKILISGAGNTETTLLAVEKFIENFLSEVPSKVYFYTTDNDAVFEAEEKEYNHSSVSVQGVPIENYRIVYAASNRSKEKENALKLQQAICEDTGWRLPVVTDKSPYDGGHEILIGITNRDVELGYLGTSTDIGCTLTQGKFVLCVGNNHSGNDVATDALLSLLATAAEAEDDVPAVMVPLRSISIYPDDNPTRITAMSFNVWLCYDEGQKAAVVDTILRYMPDTVGFQEGEPWMLTYLRQSLGGAYEFVGFGRESTLKPDGSLLTSGGEACFVMYKKERFEMLETTTTWLTSTPNVPSKIEPDQTWMRIITKAVLKDKITEETFVAFSTHTNGETYGLQEITYAMEQVIPYLDAGMPVYLVGDLNIRPDSRTYQYMSGLMDDSRYLANSYGNNGHTAGSVTIDYIWCSKENMVVDYFTVLDEPIYPNGYDGKYASDHRAVMATLVF